MVSAEGSNVSDGTSQCTESVAAHGEQKHDQHVDHVHGAPGLITRGGPLSLSHDDTLTETESIISSRQGHHHLHKTSRHHAEKYEKYHKYNGTLFLYKVHISYFLFRSCDLYFVISIIILIKCFKLIFKIKLVIFSLIRTSYKWSFETSLWTWI